MNVFSKSINCNSAPSPLYNFSQILLNSSPSYLSSMNPVTITITIIIIIIIHVFSYYYYYMSSHIIITTYLFNRYLKLPNIWLCLVGHTHGPLVVRLKNCSEVDINVRYQKYKADIPEDRLTYAEAMYDVFT